MAAADDTHTALLPVPSAATTLLPLSTLTSEALVTPHHTSTATNPTTLSTVAPSYKPLATSLPPVVELSAEDLRHRLWKARRDKTAVHTDNGLFHGRTLSYAVTHADVWSVVKETRAVRRAAVDWYGWLLHRYSLGAHAQGSRVNRTLVFSADCAEQFPADCPEDIANHYEEAVRHWSSVGQMVPCGQNLVKDYDVLVWPVVAKNGADWSVVTARLSNDTKMEMDFEVTHYDPQGLFDPSVVAIARTFLRLYVAMKSDPPRIEGVNFTTEKVKPDCPAQKHASGVMTMWVMRCALFNKGNTTPLPTGSLVPRIAMHLARELVADCLIVEVNARTQITEKATGPHPAAAAAAAAAATQKTEGYTADKEKKRREDKWTEHVHDLAKNYQGVELDEALAHTEDIPDTILHQKVQGALTLTLTYRDLATLASACTDGVNESVARWYLWLRLVVRSWNRKRNESWMSAYVIDFSTVKGVPAVESFDVDRYDIIIFPFFDTIDSRLVISFIAILPNHAPDGSAADGDPKSTKVVYCHPEEQWDRARLLRAVRLYNEYRLAQGEKQTLFTVKQITLPDDASCKVKDGGLSTLRLMRTAVTCERYQRDINEFRTSVMLELVRDDSAASPASVESQTLAEVAEALQGKEFTMKASDSLDDDAERETDEDDDVDEDEAKPQVEAKPVRPRNMDEDEVTKTILCGLIKKKPKKKDEKKEQEVVAQAPPQPVQPQKKTEDPPKAPTPPSEQQPPAPAPASAPAPPTPVKTEPEQDESVSVVADEDDKSKRDDKKRKHRGGHKSESKHKHRHKDSKSKNHKRHHKKKEPEGASALTTAEEPDEHKEEQKEKTETAEPQEPAAEPAAPATVQNKPIVTRCQCERTIEKSPSVLTAVVVPAPAKPLVAKRVHLKKEPAAAPTTPTTTPMAAPTTPITPADDNRVAAPVELGTFPHLDKANSIKLEMFIERIQCEDPDSVMATLGATLGGIPQQCVLEACDLATFAPQTTLSVRAFTWYCCMLQSLADHCDGPVRRVIVHPDVVSQWRSTRKQRACNQLLGRALLFKPNTDVLVPLHSSDAAWSLVVVQNGASPATTTRLCCYDPCGVQTPDDVKEVENMLQALRAGFGAEPYHAPLVQEHVPMPPECVPDDPHDNAIAVLFTVRALVLGEALGMPAALLRTYRMHAAYEVKKNTLTDL